MARKSLIARNNKRIKLNEKYAKKRAEMKKNGDYEGLQKLPRNSSPTRIKNRCAFTGRSRGYMLRLVFLELHFERRQIKEIYQV